VVTVRYPVEGVPILPERQAVTNTVVIPAVLAGKARVVPKLDDAGLEMINALRVARSTAIRRELSAGTHSRRW